MEKIGLCHVYFSQIAILNVSSEAIETKICMTNKEGLSSSVNEYFLLSQCVRLKEAEILSVY